MNRPRRFGGVLVAVGAVLFALLVGLGAIRHPVSAAESTSEVEYLAIGVSLVLATVGLLLVMAASIPD